MTTEGYPKCIWLMPDKSACPEDAVYDGQCEWHMEYAERAQALGKEIYNVLLRTLPSEQAESVGDAIMHDVIHPEYDFHAAEKIQSIGINRTWVDYRERVKSWRRKLVQRNIDSGRAKEIAENAAEALEKSRALDRIVIERQRQQLIRGARDRAKLVAERAFARENETRLRSDFGELAKDLKKVVRHLAPPLGGDQHPEHGRWLMELHSWRATAEILADKELSDNLDKVRKAPIEDFGEVPRPEWRCHIHPNLEPNTRPNGDRYCSEGMCIQGQGD